MTKQEKRRFMRELTTNILRNALAKVSAMPDEWDGHELRQYLADSFARQVSSTMLGKRLRDYRNAVIVSNL